MSAPDSNFFLTTVVSFTPNAEDDYYATILETSDTQLVLKFHCPQIKHAVLLDTQSAIHLISDLDLLTEVGKSTQPITVQGITGDKITVISEGTINKLGIKAYHSNEVAANILGYHKLQESHAANILGYHKL